MYSELMNKFLQTSENIWGIIVVDRENETPIEYSLKKNIDIKEIEEISRAIVRSLKVYESNKTKADLITMIFNTNDYTIIADDYQDNGKVLIILFSPNYLMIKFAGENATYLKQIINKIKAGN